MPKRWLVVAGGSYTWEYADEDDKTGSRVILAQSNERWETAEEVERAIEEIRGNADIRRHEAGAK